MFRFITKIFLTVLSCVNPSSATPLSLFQWTNETRHKKWHKKYKCRLDASVHNNKQRWNDNKCWCECKELIDKCVCDRGYIWNYNNCEYEFDKSCDAGECLNYKNSSCRKKLAYKLVEECIETVEEVKVANKNKHKNKCSSCILYLVLFSIFFTIIIRIGAYLVYYKYMNRNKENFFKSDYVYQAKNY